MPSQNPLTRTPLQRLAFAAVALSLARANARPDRVSDFARLVDAELRGPSPRSPAERLLLAAAELYVERGPIACEVLGFAVKHASQEWAERADPGTRAARPRYWYDEELAR